MSDQLFPRIRLPENASVDAESVHEMIFSPYLEYYGAKAYQDSFH